MDKSKIIKMIKMLKNFKSRIFLFCHFRVGGNPELANNTLDSRLRGNDRGNASTCKSSVFRKKLSAKSYQLKAILSAFRNLQPKTYHLKPNNGFAMLFSVLISSLLVVIGLSIFNITLKELTISTSGRESQTAFYAANSGMECSLYWDLKQNAFATSTTDYTSQQVNAVCNATRVNTSISRGATTVTTASSIPVTDSDVSCFDITISKTPNSPTASQMTTTIESRGRNICGTSGRRVERGLKATVITNM